jgi:hypothetical protein
VIVVQQKSLSHHRVTLGVTLVEPSYSLIYAAENKAALLRAVVPRPFMCVRDRGEFAWQIRKGGVGTAFVDVDLLDQLGSESTMAPIVAIVDEDPSTALVASVRMLIDRPWLSHVVTTRMLASPQARVHVSMLVERLARGVEHPVLSPLGVGRVAHLAQASRRDARLDRIGEFFEKQGLSRRALEGIREICEELVMNALYDAPVEAGFFKHAVPRTQDVELPPERACEISYGYDSKHAFVRVRDTFGALSRSRLAQVLERCMAKNVVLDESRGGAGLGMWRVFSTASTISITVVPGKVTDILVGLTTKDGRITKELLAAHLHFTQPAVPVPDVAFDHEMFDQSITLVGAFAG